MGLDMYLTANVSPGFNTSQIAPEFATALNVAVTSARKAFHLPESQDWNISLNIEIAYWRKVNAVHKWFVDNVQDGNDNCERYYVSFDQLSELVDTCRKVLEDNSRAGELLPPTEGFFFGGTDLDEWYFQGLEYTVLQLGPLVAAGAPDIMNVGFYYQSSW